MSCIYISKIFNDYKVYKPVRRRSLKVVGLIKYLVLPENNLCCFVLS